MEKAPNATEIAQLALESVSSTRDFAELVITYVSLGIGLFALLGIGAIWVGVRWYARRVATQVANERFNQMIRHNEFNLMVRHELQRHIEQVIPYQPQSPYMSETPYFPNRPQR